MQTFLRKTSPYLETLFVLFILFAYLPFFIYCNTPVINWDSWAYLLIAQDFSLGQVPLENYPADLPYGLSFFIFILLKIGFSLKALVVFQLTFFTGSSIFLINQCKKLNALFGLIVLLFMSAFAITSEIMLHNVMVYTEAIYTSGLLFVGGGVIGFYRKQSLRYLFPIGLGILLMIYLRSNGLYILFLPLAMAGLSLFRKSKAVLPILAMLAIVLLINSSTNLYVKGYFMPGEMNRVLSKLNPSIAPKKQVTQKTSKSLVSTIPEPSSKEQRIKVILNIGDPTMGNFYYYRMPIYSSKFLDSVALKEFVSNNIFYKTSFDSDKIVDYAYCNFNFNKPQYKTIKKNLDINVYPRKAWLYANHILHLTRYLWRNIGVTFLYYLSFVLSLFYYFKTLKSKDHWFWELVILIHLIHLISILYFVISPPRFTSLMRYCIVTEPFAYIGMVFTYGKIFLKERWVLKRE